MGPVIPTRMSLSYSFSSIAFNSRLSNGYSSHSKSAGLKSAFVWSRLNFLFHGTTADLSWNKHFLIDRLVKIGSIRGGIVAVL